MSRSSASQTGKLSTREELLRWAQELLQCKGLSGFSFQDLADHLKIKKASIHYYFPTKQDLVEAIIENYHQTFSQWEKSVEDQSAVEKWNSLIRLFRKTVLEEKKLCPSGALIPEVATLPKEVRKKLCHFQIEQRNWIEAMIRQGQSEESFSPHLRPKTTALVIGATIQGSLQIARLHDSPEVFEAAMKEIHHLLRASSRRKLSSQ